MIPSPDRSFFPGMLTGIAAAAVLVHVWFAFLLAPLRDTYAELGGEVPPMTTLVVSRGWQCGIPLIGVALVAGLLAVRPRRLGPYVACALLLVTTVVFAWWCSQSPLRALADNIHVGP